MAKEPNLSEMIKKEFETLTAEKNDLLAKVAEIDKKLEPVLAYLGAGKKKAVGGKKRGRKPKVVAEKVE